LPEPIEIEETQQVPNKPGRLARPLLEIADLIRTAGAAFIERNHQWIRWRHCQFCLCVLLIVRLSMESKFSNN
jgi:hypothetical protein